MTWMKSRVKSWTKSWFPPHRPQAWHGGPAAPFLASLCISSLACLPGDTRPTPETLLVTVSPDQAITSGIPPEQTADGWGLSFQRFLVSVGRVTLDGDDCNEYSDTTYTRILDAAAGPGQKMSEHFALGSCDVSFGVFPPPPDARVGSGVNDADLLFMRTPLSDGIASAGGVSMYVEGQARRGSETKHFAWPYRWVADYENCRTTGESALSMSYTLDLVSGESATLDLLVSGAALFRNAPSAAADLRFDPFAAADTESGNGDGEITLDELSQVPLSALSSLGGYAEPAPADLGRIATRIDNPPTLRDYLYTVAFPSVVQFDDQGSCDLQLRTGRRFLTN
jgi:hypothetical protein